MTDEQTERLLAALELIAQALVSIDHQLDDVTGISDGDDLYIRTRGED